jgi:hypothetical protein
MIQMWLFIEETKTRMDVDRALKKEAPLVRGLFWFVSYYWFSVEVGLLLEIAVS